MVNGTNGNCTRLMFSATIVTLRIAVIVILISRKFGFLLVFSIGRLPLRTDNKFKFVVESKHPQHLDFHFYASSGAIWAVDSDVDKLIYDMKRDGYSFGLWFIPHSIKTTYDIKLFAPVIDGASYLGYYELQQNLNND